uniref:AlNc14C118G6591 protein n=1 Tax=Albugo laibachii Nc14 TaxID=890382 RepID=F0WJ60_9STRA|nr:AlNc14C118G6591 [Albugo laibachii Nc14]|eukprot:CCA21306.1 AlNc14C118G6591 [Albugo laibachii Nc14]
MPNFDRSTKLLVPCFHSVDRNPIGFLKRWSKRTLWIAGRLDTKISDPQSQNGIGSLFTIADKPVSPSSVLGRKEANKRIMVAVRDSAGDSM